MANKKFIVPMSGPLSVGDDSGKIGNLSDLTTTDKTNIVSSINEVNGKFPVAIADGGTGGTTASEARTNLGLADVLVGTELYANNAGGSGSIQLSDEYTNYRYLYVQYMRDDVYGSEMLYRWHGSKLCISNSSLKSDGSALEIRTAVLEFSGDTVTWSRSGTMTINTSTGNATWLAGNDAVVVTQVVGYKYLNG